MGIIPKGSPKVSNSTLRNGPRRSLLTRLTYARVWYVYPLITQPSPFIYWSLMDSPHLVARPRAKKLFRIRHSDTNLTVTFRQIWFYKRNNSRIRTYGHIYKFYKVHNKDSTLRYWFFTPINELHLRNYKSQIPGIPSRFSLEARRRVTKESKSRPTSNLEHVMAEWIRRSTSDSL